MTFWDFFIFLVDFIFPFLDEPKKKENVFLEREKKKRDNLVSSPLAGRLVLG